MLCNFIIYPQEIQQTSKVSDNEDHLGICTKSLNNSKSHSKLLHQDQTTSVMKSRKLCRLA